MVAAATRSAARIAAAAIAGASAAAGLVDDRQVTIASAQDVALRRQALVAFVWGASGFPSEKLPASVEIGTPSPIGELPNLARVDTLHIAMDNEEVGLAVHFIPANPNHRLVIVHQGHACALDAESTGVAPAIGALLQANYSVLGVYMPRFRPGDCAAWDGLFGVFTHDRVFRIDTAGSPLKLFLEPVAVSLNYLRTQSAADAFPWYREFDMLGLSGGGWTTTLYAAIDPTILLSFPVAGSIPLYLRTDPGDLEQYVDAFYQLAGYPDLYALGSFGAARQQVQILNRRDNCCFGEGQHDAELSGMSFDEAVRDYEARVQQAVQGLGSGAFRLVIDEDAPLHTISPTAVQDVILPTLASRGICPAAPAPCVDAAGAVISTQIDDDRAERARLRWDWRGRANGMADFGDPTASTDYALCLYDDGTLVADYAVAAQGMCGDRPCWQRLGDRGYKFSGRGSNADGIEKVELKLRSGGRAARLAVYGEGASLPLPDAAPLFSQTVGLTAQLFRSDGPGCWQSRFAPPAKTRTSRRFKDKVP